MKVKAPSLLDKVVLHKDFRPIVERPNKCELSDVRSSSISDRKTEYLTEKKEIYAIHQVATQHTMKVILINLLIILRDIA